MKWPCCHRGAQRKAPGLSPCPAAGHPPSCSQQGSASPIRFLLLQLLMAFLNPHSVRLTLGWHSKRTQKRLQPRRNQRLETKKAPFRYLFVCLQFSPSVDGQGFQGPAPGKGNGRNQFAVTSDITGHRVISDKSLWRTNPVWKRATGLCKAQLKAGGRA